jgi:ABC-type phosphate/phosphonate transport system substrate-binding protein
MSGLIAALPMYDWPERRAEVDALWAMIRDRLRAAGVDAPEALTRKHGDLLDFWKRPDLLFAQTCWGPMEQGLADYVQVVGQPRYDGIEGGQGELYSSAIVMRRADVDGAESVAAPLDGRSILPLVLMYGARLAYNVPDSMSGIIGLTRDLESLGAGLDLFSELVETGGHRKSIRFVAEGKADIAAIDCKSWALAMLYEPDAVAKLQVVGWTAQRTGLPYITANSTPPDVVEKLKAALAGL